MDGWKAYSNRMEYRPKTNINKIDEGNLSQGQKYQIGRFKFLSFSHPSIHLSVSIKHLLCFRHWTKD